MPQKVLALDLSTSTGWALLEGEELLAYGALEAPSTKVSPYPWNYLNVSKQLAIQVKAVVDQHRPSLVVIEELNAARQRHSQKLLSFIHFAVLDQLEWAYEVAYVDTSAWRKTLGIKLTKEQRQQNKLSKAKKKALGIAGKVTVKHLAVAYCTEKYRIPFKQKDNDICEAIALGLALHRGCPVSKPKPTKE